ncbi:helix-turn-helix domain-containing protein [Rhodococcus sp. HS-D2]|uniref:helix-turn-helix domain-containing protein n=1 Tax=Rhodococcus sp. HS-D2 TaxID=1384636 RepID=UPI0007D9AF99|nr:helix-turn-helix domain-containing protein [Rhodococcus sp. HS-D2]
MMPARPESVQPLIATIAVPAPVARELLDALARLEQLAHDRGFTLAPHIHRIRADLAAALAVVTTDDRASTSVPDLLGDLLFRHDAGLVDTATAAQRLGITPGGVRDLCRRGRLPAVRRHGRYWITTDDLDALAAARASN